MASACIRSVRRASLSFSSLRPCIAPPKPAARGAPTARLPNPAAPSSGRRFPSFSRLPVELASCGGSLLPLHSAVAAARMTSRLSTESRSCRALSQGTLCRTYPGL